MKIQSYVRKDDFEGAYRIVKQLREGTLVEGMKMEKKDMSAVIFMPLLHEAAKKVLFLPSFFFLSHLSHFSHLFLSFSSFLIFIIIS